MQIGDKVENKWDSLREFVWDLEQDQQEKVYHRI